MMGPIKDPCIWAFARNIDRGSNSAGSTAGVRKRSAPLVWATSGKR